MRPIDEMSSVVLLTEIHLTVRALFYARHGDRSVTPEGVQDEARCFAWLKQLIEQHQKVTGEQHWDDFVLAEIRKRFP